MENFVSCFLPKKLHPTVDVSLLGYLFVSTKSMLFDKGLVSDSVGRIYIFRDVVVTGKTGEFRTVLNLRHSI